jgi:hypothetical protein
MVLVVVVWQVPWWQQGGEHSSHPSSLQLHTSVTVQMRVVVVLELEDDGGLMVVLGAE